MPGWALSERLPAGKAGEPFGQGGAGLVLWTKGDFEFVSAIGPGGPELETQGNAAIPSFNPGLRSKGAPGGGYGPLTGIDMLDGVPGTTWSTDRAGEVVVYLEPPDGSGARQLKDRNGVPFVPGVSTLTWLAVVIARISTTFGNNLGGTIFSLGNTAANAGQDIEPLFNIGPGYGGPADGFFLFSNEWPGLYGYTNALKGADQPGFETGPYVDVPLLLHYESVGTTFRAYVSGSGIGTMVPIALSSSTIPAPAPVGLVNFAYGCTNRILGPFHTDHWVGARFEDLAYDFELSTNPSGLSQTYGYFAERYPALGIVVP